MRCWIAGFLLFSAQLVGAKTKLVEDPNCVVAGRYTLTAVYLGGAIAFSTEDYRK
jgi:hypothetical protein